MAIIQVTGFQCERCEWKWAPRLVTDDIEIPVKCPRCNSPYWNRPRKYKGYENIDRRWKKKKG